jgi:hypothetical protein
MLVYRRVNGFLTYWKRKDSKDVARMEAMYVLQGSLKRSPNILVNLDNSPK